MLPTNFKLAKSPADLEPYARGLRDFQLNNKPASRGISGAFTQGELQFPFSVPNGTAFIPSQSYFRVQVSMTSPAVTPLLYSNHSLTYHFKLEEL